MGFSLPVVNDNKDGWGPGAPPEKFEGMPYAPFEKRAFIGRMADWSARAEQYRERMRNRPAAVRARPPTGFRPFHPRCRPRPPNPPAPRASLARRLLPPWPPCARASARARVRRSGG